MLIHSIVRQTSKLLIYVLQCFYLERGYLAVFLPGTWIPCSVFTWNVDTLQCFYLERGYLAVFLPGIWIPCSVFTWNLDTLQCFYLERGYLAVVLQ